MKEIFLKTKYENCDKIEYHFESLKQHRFKNTYKSCKRRTKILNWSPQLILNWPLLLFRNYDNFLSFLYHSSTQFCSISEYTNGAHYKWLLFYLSYDRRNVSNKSYIDTSSRICVKEKYLRMLLNNNHTVITMRDEVEASHEISVEIS